MSVLKGASGDAILQGNDARISALSPQRRACLEHTDSLNGALACGPPGEEVGEGIGKQSPYSCLKLSHETYVI